MALRPEDLDFVSQFDTVWAVILGAVLATAGGFAATQMERIVGRRERERNSALLFGEVLATLAVILEIAGNSRGIGEPYGAVTMRILRSARREIDIYERNRERLFDLEDGALRIRVHTFMVRLAMPLDNFFDVMRELTEARLAASASPEPSEEGEALIARLEEQREQEFDFLIENAGRLRQIIARLEPIARHSFEGLGDIARSPA